MITRLATLITALGLTLIVSCGGGGGIVADGGIGGSGISNGTVTAFGSIFVNGVEFDTSNAIFTRGGQPAVESDYSVGEVVTVAGTFNTDGVTGTARSVRYQANVSGSVTETPSAASGRIEVLGQTVVVTPSTVLDNFAALTDVSAGNILEVSGFANADGSVNATHIVRQESEFQPGATTSAVRGVVTNLDEVSMTFNLDDLVVDFSAPQIMNRTLANGQSVEVVSDTNVINGELAADTVNVTDPTLARPGDELDIEGVVSRFASLTDFTVGSQRVTTTMDTAFEDGGIANLGLNVALEVSGQVNSSGVLVAQRIVFRLPQSTFTIGGFALAVNVSAGTITIQSANFSPIEVTTDSRTRFADNSEVPVQPFGLVDIGIGDQIRVTAFQSGNVVTAIQIERESLIGGGGGTGGIPPDTGIPPPDTGIPPPPDTGTPPPPDTGTPPPPDIGGPPPDTGTPPPPDIGGPPPDTGTPPPPDIGGPPPDTGTPPPPDIGGPPPDTGIPPPDTGTPPPDTGTPPPPDTGTPPPDTGTPPPDTGTPPPDTGTPPPPDTGTPPPDTGIPPVDTGGSPSGSGTPPPATDSSPNAGSSPTA